MATGEFRGLVALRNGEVRTSPSTLLRTAPPLCPASVLNRSRGLRLRLSLRIRTTGSQVPCKGLNPRSCHLHAGCHLANRQAPAKLVPADQRSRWFRHRLTIFDTSAVVHLHSTPWLVPDKVIPLPFPVSLTTLSLKQRSSQRFRASACTAALEGLPPSFT